MKNWLALAVGLAVLSTALAQDLRDTLFREAEGAQQAAQQANAPLLAPQAYSRGTTAYADAQTDFERGRNMDRIRARLTTSVEAFQEASRAASIASITLASLIKTRDDAVNARAEAFAADLWNEGESEFNSAARRLEAGDLRGARRRADTAEQLYRDAELTAIKAQYLSQTRALLLQAQQARVSRLAPLTLARAESLLVQAEQELSENRYDTDLPRSLAQQANYQARHAIFLAEHIRSLRDQGLSLEEIVLSYEEALTEIAATVDIVAQMDRGVDAVVRDLVGHIEELRERSQQSTRDLEDSRMRVAELEEEIRLLDERLGGVTQERVALVQRLEADARIRQQFESVEALFNREEARVSREGNHLVMRLVGLTFPSGSANVDPSHGELLGKVRQAANVFPRAQLVIEGHTDSYGSDEANMVLSRRRAEAVSNYLTGELGIPAFRISAVGYGETRPIASNETSQGRERNRRIDVRIEPQLD